MPDIVTAELQNVVSPETVRFVKALEVLYQEPESKPGSVDPETGRFLHSLVRLIRAELVVEIGTHLGVSTLWLARGVADNCSGGQVLSVDLFKKPSLLEVERIIQQAGLSQWVRLIRGASAVEGVQACRAVGRAIDFLFIDGDHRIEGCAGDFQSFSAMVRIGGLVVLHDIYPAACGWDGPRYVLNFIAENPVERAKWQVLELPTPSIDNYGLAVLKRIEPGVSRILPRPAYWAYRFKMLLRKLFRSQ